MATGEIVTLRTDKCFGFIKEGPRPSGENNLFFHRSAVTSGSFDELTEGQIVSFDAGTDPRDPSRFRANNVRPISASGDAPTSAFDHDER